jgi:4-deoxy-L-threo-5-hexosulose-uronate ketol-isomerase
MTTYHQVHPEDFSSYNTATIRERFLLEHLVVADKIECAYTHYDRMVIGAACPVNNSLQLGTYDQLKTEHFLGRREIGILNIAGNGHITVEGEKFALLKMDCLYIGMGKQDIVFSSENATAPAKFIFFSCPAHQNHPTHLMHAAAATPAAMGSLDNNNERTINKYIHSDGIKSCQLLLGVTSFKKGSIWNTMPPHLHDRRMESYFYFDLPEDQRIIHFMGKPNETRHIILNNEQAILSPSWSIHSGVATASYSFIWAMAGENMSFTDMDAVTLKSLQ